MFLMDQFEAYFAKCCKRVHEHYKEGIQLNDALKQIAIDVEPTRDPNVEIKSISLAVQRPGTPITGLPWDAWQHRFASERAMMEQNMLHGITEE